MGERERGRGGEEGEREGREGVQYISFSFFVCIRICNIYTCKCFFHN